MPHHRRSALLAAVLTAALTAVGCTSSPGTPITGAAVADSSSAAATSRAAITTTPTDGAAAASVLDPVVVRAADGTLDAVTMTNPEGAAVSGALTADRTSWSSAEPLGYGRTYTITATARDAAGLTTEASSSFTTLTPAGTIFPSFQPAPDTGTVGVGQPIAVIFDQAPPDQATAERALTVTSVPAQLGSWYWVDDRTVHYRPKDYWTSGTQITVDAKIYGIDLGGGLYGETDRTLSLTVGQSKIAAVDDATKQMTVTVDGQVVRTIPVSMGMNQSTTVDGQEISFVTPSGTYVAQEKYEVKQMSSASYGLPTDFELGYDQAIPLAVRLSNSGIFAHSAPWSVADQGVRNVSHGCINLPPDDAQWFYDTFSHGDIVTVTGTSTQLAPDDGYGDWNITWEQWQAGSALT